MQRPKAVIFDMDGTLYPFEPQATSGLPRRDSIYGAIRLIQEQLP